MAVLPGRALMPEDGALRGVFLHKNVLGWVACLTVVLGIAARLDVSARMRRTGLLLLVAGLAALLLSTSVTSLFAAFAAVVVSRVVLLVARLQGRTRLAVVLGLILLIPLLALLLAVGFGPLLEALGKDPTLTGRVPLWSMIDAEISRHPLLGHGYGVFWTEGNPAVWSIWESQGWQAPNAHNGYRETMLGLGSVGLLLLIALTFRAVAQGVTLCSMAPGEGWILPVLIVCISLILNLSESIFLKQNDLLWLLYSASVISISCRHAALRHPVPEPACIVATAI
ncbi:O-antigen ligase family protein [Paracoccus aerius]